jgi:hypothetical protein
MNWEDHPASDATDPVDGGEPIVYWWEDMRPAEVCELVKRAYERGVARGAREYADALLGCYERGVARGAREFTDALLDCYDRAEEADERLQENYEWLERVVDVINAQKEALRAVEYIQRIVVQAFGGVSPFLLAQNEREKREGYDPVGGGGGHGRSDLPYGQGGGDD